MAPSNSCSLSKLSKNSVNMYCAGCTLGTSINLSCHKTTKLKLLSIDLECMQFGCTFDVNGLSKFACD